MESYTIKTVKNALRAYGITLKPITEAEEFRVNYSGGTESTAYNTNDLGDAYRTGVEMANWRLRNVSYDASNGCV
jgi:hypothetical protein